MFELEIVKHAEENPEEEVCGFILLNNNLCVEVERSKNESQNKKECFAISPAKFIENKITKKILGIYHSHPFTAEKPSPRDKACSEEMGIPYLIYSLKSKKFFLYHPDSYEEESLTQRPYVKAFYECISIFRDYYKKQLDINISKWNKNYWLPENDTQANKLLKRILNKNMDQVEGEEIKKHDLIVFELKKDKRFHVGVYLGEDKFIHQPDKLLSREQLLDDRWQNKIKHVYRHPSLV